MFEFRKQVSLGFAALSCQPNIAGENYNSSAAFEYNRAMSVSRVFLFGTQNRLCGIHHVPARSGARGLLICPPLLHESSRTHWALRQMAIGCANRGIDVVQFDFTGCGNSPGPLPREKVTDWQTTSPRRSPSCAIESANTLLLPSLPFDSRLRSSPFSNTALRSVACGIPC